EEPFSTSTDCIVATSKREDVKTKFVYYYLYGNLHLLERGFKGAGLKHISKAYIESLEVPIFPVDIQNKIVTVLDRVNSLLIKRIQSNQLLHELLRATFLNTFGNVSSFEKTKDSTPLGDHISIRHGFAFKSEHFRETGHYFLLTPGNFKES